MNNRCRTILLLLALLAPLAGRAEHRTWNRGAGVTDNWFTATNWLPADDYPRTGDTVSVTNGFILLTNATEYLAAFTISNATLIWTNWNTTLSASNLMLRNGAVLTHVANSATTTNESGAWVPDARVTIACSNLTVEAGGVINASGMGYTGGSGYPAARGPGRGPGGGLDGASYGGGGGYGGKGGTGAGSAGGPAYGSNDLSELQPGSGGGGSSSSSGIPTGGAGGGLVVIACEGEARVDGTIAAKGFPTNAGNYRAGGGAGGGIRIACRTFVGQGEISTQGGRGDNGYGGGNGGGGRVAVIFNQAAQAAVDPKPTVIFSSAGGTGNNNAAGIGTLFFPDTAVFAPVISMWAYLYFSPATNAGMDSLTVSNAYTTFSDFRLAVTNNLTVKAGARLTFTNTPGLDAGRLEVGGNVLVTNSYLSSYFSGLEIGGDCSLNTGRLYFAFDVDRPNSLVLASNFFLTNGSVIYLYAGPTNAVTTNYGGILNLSGRQLVIPTNCAIYPAADGTNGGAIKIQAGSLTVAAGGRINADGLGFMGRQSARGYGPGGGYFSTEGGGGGYGGRGGNYGGGIGGPACGATNWPVLPGSGGAASSSFVPGNAGGLVWIEASGAVRVDGTLSADGVAGAQGAGSGGGIAIAAKAFSGSALGVLRAVGGQGGGGGGGGRIAVWCDVSPGIRARHVASGFGRSVALSTNWPEFAGAVSVSNGYTAPPYAPAEPGTAFFFRYRPGAQFRAPGHP